MIKQETRLNCEKQITVHEADGWYETATEMGPANSEISTKSAVDGLEDCDTTLVLKIKRSGE